VLLSQIENPKPSFFKEWRYSHLNSYLSQIGYVLVNPVSATGTNKGGFSKVNEFHLVISFLLMVLCLRPSIAELSGIRVTEKSLYFGVRRISVRVPPKAGFTPEARQVV